MPLRAGLEREALRSRLRCPPVVFNALLEKLSREGQILEGNTQLQLPMHRIEFTFEQEQSIAQLMSRLESQDPVPQCEGVQGDGADVVYYALVDLAG